MKADVFHRAKEVFGDALDLPTARRAEFVDRACAGDASLLGEVRSLLAAREAVSTFWLGSAGAGLVVATLDAGRAPNVTESGTFAVAEPPVPPPTTGAVVAGRYELGARLGAGAFGAVYAARDRVSQQAVAVKVLPLAGGAGFKMLRRETAILRLVKLPGIVEMIDDGIDGPHAFIAMRLVEGERFGGDGRVAWDALAPRARGLLEALARLHWLGVLHRDVKPENVLVGKDGRVTIVDLGIAWEGDGPAKTASGAYAAGTPAYLAPECLRGRPASVASDVYSVGVMLFEALAGRRLHGGSSLRSLIDERCDAPAPRLADVATDVPPHVAAAVDSMLALDPAERPASAAHALAMLRGAGELPPTLRLPRVGGTESVDRLVEAVKAGRSADVGGPRGSGRSRLLDDAAERLAADGYLVVRTKPAQRPFESLAPVLGAVPDHAEWSADQVRAWVERRLSLALSDGFIVFADDVASLDRASADALDACRARGRVVRVVDGDAADVVLGPIAETDLRPLFRGPDRIHHLREDGARELFRRTRGVAADVVRELSAWIDQGYARVEDGLVVVDRVALDRLAARVLVSPPVKPELGAGLGASARGLATYFALAGGAVDPRALATALGRPAWEIDLDVDELLRAGVLRRLDDGRVEALAAVESHAALPADRRCAIHSALADALSSEDEHRLAHLVAAGRLDEVPRAACDVASAFMRAGRPNSALIVASDGAGVLGRMSTSDADVAEELLFLLMDAAISVGTAQALDLALYQCGRARSGTRRAKAIETICRAALLTVQGDHVRALAALDGQFFDAGLDRWRHVVRGFAARQGDDTLVERRIVADTVRWARRVATEDARSYAAHVTGWLRFRAGRYLAASRLHARAARLARNPRARLGALVDAGLAAIEAMNFEHATTLARKALVLAAELRIADHEARAEWMNRTIGYRTGAIVRCDHELAEAVAGPGSANTRGVVLLNEAAIAWRAHEAALAATLARRASDVLRAAGRRWSALLAESLAIACGGETRPERRGEIVAELAQCPLPGVALQACGLLGESLVGVGEYREGDVLLAGDRENDGRRREVLSLAEALSRSRTVH